MGGVGEAAQPVPSKGSLKSPSAELARTAPRVALWEIQEPPSACLGPLPGALSGDRPVAWVLEFLLCGSCVLWEASIHTMLLFVLTDTVSLEGKPFKH